MSESLWYSGSLLVTMASDPIHVAECKISSFPWLSSVSFYACLVFLWPFINAVAQHPYFTAVGSADIFSTFHFLLIHPLDHILADFSDFLGNCLTVFHNGCTNSHLNRECSSLFLLILTNICIYIDTYNWQSNWYEMRSNVHLIWISLTSSNIKHFFHVLVGHLSIKIRHYRSDAHHLIEFLILNN